MRSRRIATAVAAALALGGLLWAQSPRATEPAGMSGPMHGSAKPSGDTMADCEAMKAKHRMAMGEIEAMDARLGDLVRAMNAATGNAKVEATAAVVAEIVSQRSTMRSRMDGLHASMMEHMMGHVQRGTSSCPMMSGDKGEREGHEAHH